MAGQADPSRDLRLGLHALESGAVDAGQLIAAIAEWASTPGRSLGEVFAKRGILERSALARLEDEANRNGTFRRGDHDPSATVTYAGRPVDGDAPDTVAGASGNLAREIAGGRFEVLRPHARGGLGEVFLAFDRELKRSVALKELMAGLARDPAAQARFVREAEITGSLEHPGIVPVYSLGRYPDGRPYYAMHFVQGETLRAAIKRFHQKDASPGVPEHREPAFRRLLRSMIDASNAVAYAHSRGVIHRDLKPDNIMLGPFGETLVVDWGLAKLVDSDHSQEIRSASSPEIATGASMTQPGSLLGTPRYMSPEQAAGKLDNVGPPTDIYSLGAIFYGILVGHDPFPDGDLPDVLGRVARGIFPAPRRLLRSVDPALEAICMKAMALDPRDRHATALELASEVESWLTDVRFRQEQQAAVSQAQATVAQLCLERAYVCFGKTEHSEGMLWLARALEHASPGTPDLECVIRTSLSSWHKETKLLERSLRHGGATHAVAFCPEGRRLATASEDRAARLWDVATGSLFASPLKHDGPVHSIAFASDGKIVATAAHDKTIRRWDAWTGEPLGKPLATDGVSALIFSPDGSMLAALSNAGELLLWKASDGQPLDHSVGRRSPAAAIAFAGDGAIIAVAHEDGTVTLREARSGTAIAEPLAHTATVRALAFDPGGSLLLTGTRDGDVRLWDLPARSALLTLSHPTEIRHVAFRPDGGAFATEYDDGTARLWESATGRPIGGPLGQQSRVNCLAFRPDGAMLATGSPDGKIRLVCANTGLPIGPPLDQGGDVRSLNFSKDGRRIASGGTDSIVRCWKLPSPVEGTPERVSCWVSVMTNLEFDGDDAVRRMDGGTSWDKRRHLGELGGTPLR
jgi:eukaryotic-like serine/threonine-protein kinase